MNEEISDEEINRVIAEFMGFTVYSKDTAIMPLGLSHQRISFFNYTTSLDALVPVLEKLEIRITLDTNYHKKNHVWVCISGIEASSNKSIQKAAALATYKAIKLLETKE